MRWWCLALIALWPGLAAAGSGPWVLAKNDQKVYLGAETQRFTRLAVSSGSYADDVIDVDDGTSTLGFKAIVAYGVTRGFELELELPYYHVFAPRTDGPVCTLLGLGACQRTTGLGVVVVRGKGQVLDEVLGAPLSIGLGLDLRFGQLTAKDRARITNLGEGTFDLEPRLSLGRTGALGKKGGYWSAAWDLSWRYRFPLREQVGDEARPVPSWEVTSQLEALFTPRPVVSIGPSFDLFWRPLGYDFEDVDLTDVDRFGALRGLRFSGGAKLIVRGSDRVDVSVSAYRVIYAENNPSDTLLVNAGVSLRGLFTRRRSDG